MKKQILRILSLTMALSLLLTSCGITPPGGATATTMHLRQTEGQVGVSDGAGKDVEPREDLGLYSGYGVDTRRESYAWIDLDEVKLTKLDEKSEIAITKEDKNLEIEVLSGSLFFNVTQPLADDETMTIRSSTMAVGIRGTCGWVALSKDGEQLTACLLEGKVECRAGEETASVSAGEMALLSTADGEETIDVHTFREGDIPDFVMDELGEELLEEARNFLAHGPTQAELDTIAYYGSCGVTERQAEAFAAVLREEIRQAEAVNADWPDGQTRCFAGLADTGGVPALVFCSGVEANNTLHSGFGSSSIWEYQDGRAVKWSGLDELVNFSICSSHLRITEIDLYANLVSIYAFEDGRISPQLTTSARAGTIDGQPVEPTEYSTWVHKWGGKRYMECFTNSVPGVTWNDIRGMSPAEDVLAVLEGSR